MPDTKSPPPRLRAEFELDGEGHPRYVDAGGRRHYRIRLSVEGAPDDTYAVTYELDPSYYDAIRESKDATNAFAERLTSYGAYAVRARVRARAGRGKLAVPLSRALEDTYAERGALISAIAEAIAEIRRR